MALVVLTGAVRSGKSAAAETMALSRGGPVVVAVAGWDGDEEMARRIEAHRVTRPDTFSVIEVGPDPGWVADVPGGAVLVLDCLATLVGAIAWASAADAEVATAGQETRASEAVEALTDALLTRIGDTIVVTNEAGWGVVPATAAGRLFRDLLGRANRALVEAADAAYLMVDGRCLDLRDLPAVPTWPGTSRDAERREGTTASDTHDTRDARDTHETEGTK
jgi:adenosylcobinamide kinase/adenosylcobinamide-phosphate guanylyltransferase